MRRDGHGLSMVGCCGLLLALMAGCAATVTALKHKDLEVQTHMSETIFLDPVAPAQQSVWLEVKSTADQPVELDALREALSARGYRVVADPDQAHYRFQVHVLYVDTGEGLRSVGTAT